MASFTISSYKKASIVALVLRQGNGSRHWETIYNKTNIAKVSPFQQASIAFRSFRENTLYVHPFNGNFYRLSEKTKTLTNSIPSGKVASLRSLLGKRWITFPFASSKKIQPNLKESRETSTGVKCLHNISSCQKHGQEQPNHFLPFFESLSIPQTTK